MWLFDGVLLCVSVDSWLVGVVLFVMISFVLLSSRSSYVSLLFPGPTLFVWFALLWFVFVVCFVVLILCFIVYCFWCVVN